MADVVTFIGWHNCGKTTLLTKVVGLLRERGWRVCVIKSSCHRGIEFDASHSDTSRLRASGADDVALVAPDKVVIMKGKNDMPLRALAHRFFPEADIVLGEGFKNAPGVDKIEVVKGGAQPGLYKEISGVVAVVAESDPPGTRVFRPTEAKELAEFIERRYIVADRERPSAHLLVNGRPIPLKFFVQQAIAGAVSGLVESLKGTQGAETIEILVKIPKKEDGR